MISLHQILILKKKGMIKKKRKICSTICAIIDLQGLWLSNDKTLHLAYDSSHHR